MYLTYTKFLNLFYYLVLRNIISNLIRFDRLYLKTISLKSIPLEILISTMEQSDLFFLDTMFQNSSSAGIHFLIVNQTHKGKELNSNSPFIRVINSYEKGLSKSRNLLLENAKGEICLIADDDAYYKENLLQKILDAYKEFKDADVITFEMEDLNGNPFIKYPQKSIKHNYKSIVGMNSNSISFRLKSIKNKNIKFNILFGLGSYFTVAEELIFMKDILNNNLSTYFKKTPILKHSILSTGKDMAADRLVYARTALAYKNYGILAFPWLIKYVFFLYVRKQILLNQVIKKIKIGVSGINKYKELIKK